MDCKTLQCRCCRSSLYHDRKFITSPPRWRYPSLSVCSGLEYFALSAHPATTLASMGTPCRVATPDTRLASKLNAALLSTALQTIRMAELRGNPTITSPGRRATLGSHKGMRCGSPSIRYRLPSDFARRFCLSVSACRGELCERGFTVQALCHSLSALFSVVLGWL